MPPVPLLRGIFGKAVSGSSSCCLSVVDGSLSGRLYIVTAMVSEGMGIVVWIA